MENQEEKLDKQGQFKSKVEIGGAIDYRINVKGKPTFKGLTNRQIREKELLVLLRKLKPHVSKAVMTAVKIMQNEEASHQNQLKAAVIILQQYKDTMEAAYDKEYDEDQGEEIQQDNAPVFSLKVIGQ